MKIDRHFWHAKNMKIRSIVFAAMCCGHRTGIVNRDHARAIKLEEDRSIYLDHRSPGIFPVNLSL